MRTAYPSFLHSRVFQSSLRLTIWLGLLSRIAGAGLAAQAQAPSPPPNFLIILADDLGYGDLQCYNPQRGKIPTPHLNRLAAQGMRFTDAHSSSGVCSPSRYALLTGRYHWRTRLQSGIVGPWEQPLIAANRLTIASLAKQHGYRTAAVGKWHLGWEWPFAAEQRKLLAPPGEANTPAHEASEAHRAAWQAGFSQPIAGGPTTRGFDMYFGTDVPNWPPFCFIENDRTQGIPSEFLPREKLENNLASKQGPALPGWKLEDVLPALGERACAFIEGAARDQNPFLLYLPLTTPHTPLAVNAAWRGKSGLDNAAADLIMETDALVGRVLETLEKSGAAENTLVLFTSDNGFAPYVGAKNLEARGHFPSGPLRDYKSSVYEGGHRVPFIVRWPGIVKPETVNEALVHQADVLATLADILGVTLPENAGEDSFSFAPLLRGQRSQTVRTHAVSCAASGVPSLRQGEWKLIAASAGARAENSNAAQSTTVQLFNLSNDLGETTNLAAKEPERAAAMQATLETIIKRGRSTLGPDQPNDVPVRRFPQSTANTGKKGKKAGPAKTKLGD